MLTKLYFSPEKLRGDTPCSGSVPSSPVRGFLFSDTRGFDVWKAVSGPGATRFFCAWSDRLGSLGGESLQFPRRWLKEPAEMRIVPSGHVHVWKRHGRITVRLNDAVEVQLRSVGMRNHVQLQRSDGTVLADFSAFGGVITFDPDLLTAEESLLLLYVLGAGLVQRARRFGIIPRTLASSPFS